MTACHINHGPLNEEGGSSVGKETKTLGGVWAARLDVGLRTERTSKGPGGIVFHYCSKERLLVDEKNEGMRISYGSDAIVGLDGSVPLWMRQIYHHRLCCKHLSSNY